MGSSTFTFGLLAALLASTAVVDAKAGRTVLRPLGAKIVVSNEAAPADEGCGELELATCPYWSCGPCSPWVYSPDRCEEFLDATRLLRKEMVERVFECKEVLSQPGKEKRQLELQAKIRNLHRRISRAMAQY